MTCIAIEVSRFLPLGELERGIEEVAEHVRTAPLRPGAPPIVLPGERGAAATREHRARGVLLTPRTLDELRDACARAGVAGPAPV